MTRKRKCHSKSNSFVAAAEQVCLQPVLEHRQRRGRRNIAWQAIAHLCSSNRKGTTYDSWPTTGRNVNLFSGGGPKPASVRQSRFGQLKFVRIIRLVLTLAGRCYFGQILEHYTSESERWLAAKIGAKYRNSTPFRIHSWGDGCHPLIQSTTEAWNAIQNSILRIRFIKYLRLPE